MRLRELRIAGFKSFADEVIIEFDDALMAIVGPNGCGKSNVVDALRWVMGEQSGKTLRADKMLDVLFGGSEKRKAANRAEVSACFEREDGSHVTITRRLYRGGESEYLVNKVPGRLKDVQRLFWGTGVGKNAFFIFEQGKLDEIIYRSAEERRALFEESAGITAFLERRKEATRRLDEIKTHLAQLKEYHGDADRKRRALKKQAEEALARSENQKKLEGFERGVFILRLDDARSFLATSEAHIENLHKEMSSLEEGRCALDAKLKEIALVKQKKAEEIKRADALFYKSESEYRLIEAEEKRAGEQLKELQLQKEKMTRALKEGREKKKREEEERAQKETLLKAGESQKEELCKADEAAKQLFLDLQERTIRRQKEEESARRDHLALLEQEKHLERQLQEKKQRLEHFFEKLTLLEKGLKEQEEKRDSLQSDERVRQEKVEQLLLVIGDFQKQSDRLEQAKEECEGICCALEQERESLSRMLLQSSAEEKALVALQQAEEGFSDDAKALLKEAKLKKSPLYGKVEPFYLHLPSHIHKELLEAARPYGALLVVKDEQDRQAVLEHAEKKGWKDFAIAILTKGGFEQLFQGIVQSPSFKALLELKDQEGYSEGYFLDHRGVLFGCGKSGKRNDALHRAATIEQLKRQIATAEEKLSGVEKKWEGAQGRKAEVLKERLATEEKRRKAEIALVEANFFMQQAIADRARLEKKREESLQERERLLPQLKALEEERGRLSVAYEKALCSAKEAFEITGLKEKERHTEEVALQEALHASRSSHERLQSHLLQYKLLQEGIYALDAKLQDIKHQEVTFAQEEKALEERMMTCTHLFPTYGEEKKKYQARIEESHSVKKDLEGLFRELLQEEKEVEKGLAHQERCIFSLVEKDKALKKRVDEGKKRESQYEEELKGTFKESVEEVRSRALFLPGGCDEMEKHIFHIKKEMEKGGEVNLNAIEEARLEEERFGELDCHLEDMKETQTEIEKLIEEMENESRRLFKKTFESIREHFKKNFSFLFNGGSADLFMTNAQNPLESGVEIIAEPPGKKMRTISLLSGGEKCLTALALLFALFEVKPAPFCILDEVDAPLDDANVERFTQIVQRFTASTQFLIVTHNKKTMASAATLLGVSMEEKGVSKLISLLLATSNA